MQEGSSAFFFFFPASERAWPRAPIYSGLHPPIVSSATMPYLGYFQTCLSTRLAGVPSTGPARAAQTPQSQMACLVGNGLPRGKWPRRVAMRLPGPRPFFRAHPFCRPSSSNIAPRTLHLASIPSLLTRLADVRLLSASRGIQPRCRVQLANDGSRTKAVNEGTEPWAPHAPPWPGRRAEGRRGRRCRRGIIPDPSGAYVVRCQHPPSPTDLRGDPIDRWMPREQPDRSSLLGRRRGARGGELYSTPTLSLPCRSPISLYLCPGLWAPAAEQNSPTGPTPLVMQTT